MLSFLRRPTPTHQDRACIDAYIPPPSPKSTSEHPTKIEQIFAKFFWGSTTEQKKIHWTKWHNICYPTEEGGLGIRNLRDMVTAFSYKLWWRVRLNNSLWSQFTISKYCQGFSPSISKLFDTDSSIWKRMCTIRTEVQANIFWSLGDGNVSFWHDWWLPEGTLANLVGAQCNLHIPVNWFWLEHEWDRQKLQQVAPQHIIDLITEVPINIINQTIFTGDCPNTAHSRPNLRGMKFAINNQHNSSINHFGRSCSSRTSRYSLGGSSTTGYPLMRDSKKRGLIGL
ncbi:UNVERIFIED_CONTAM: hypothetical protein Sradi_6879600 [Sesamum radiatum]|uniref:Uncharacterized protein n=1 Tax=Sesamum radiatum TaxID=300843 RepID=A0AAW2JJ99_SESRA